MAAYGKHGGKLIFYIPIERSQEVGSSFVTTNNKNTMIRKLSYVLGIAFILSSIPLTGISQTTTDEKTEVHHTGVKRTYKKAKRKVRKATQDTKDAVKKTYHKAKTRVTTDDATKDANERK